MIRQKTRRRPDHFVLVLRGFTVGLLICPCFGFCREAIKRSVAAGSTMARHHGACTRAHYDLSRPPLVPQHCPPMIYAQGAASLPPTPSFWCRRRRIVPTETSCFDGIEGVRARSRVRRVHVHVHPPNATLAVNMSYCVPSIDYRARRNC